MNKNKTTIGVMANVYFAVLIFFLINVFFGWVSAKVSVAKKADFLENTEIKDNNARINIDYEEQYPFADNGGTEKKPVINSSKYRYNTFVASIKNTVEMYTGEHLIGHMCITRLGKMYNNLIGCSGIPVSGDDSDRIIIMKDGYMTRPTPRKTEKELISSVDNISDFAQYLNEKGIFFVYANAGSKVNPFDNQLPEGAEEYSNENADLFLKLLNERNVNCLDYRDYMDRQYADWHSAYYITDGHWKNTTGLWAAGVLADYLNTYAGYHFDLNLFSENMYNIEMRENYFLGSEGRILTSAVVETEPFAKVLPKFDTDFWVKNPSRGIDKRGSYAETLFREDFFDSIAEYKEEDFDNKEDAYHSTLWRNDPLATVVNYKPTNNDGKRLLIIQDSFGWFLSTYLATDIPEFDQICLPGFNGSLKSYIEQTKPDTVVLLLCEKNIAGITADQYETHSSYFDFR